MAKVYIKVNEAGEITDIGSDVFIEDLTGWIQIDEGSGDKYVHAQGNYLPGPMLDEEGNPNFFGRVMQSYPSENLTSKTHRTGPKIEP